MNQRTIIGLCGYARAGKDTMAAAIVERGWTRLAFADNLKDDLRTMLEDAVRRGGAPVADIQRRVCQMLAGPDKAKARPLMVAYGAFMRTFEPDYWIARLRRQIDALPDDARVVITDVRYENEAEWVRSLGGVALWVERPGIGPANSEEAVRTRKDYCDGSLLLDATITENQEAFRGLADDYARRAALRAIAAGRAWNPVQAMKRWAHYINAEVGGIDTRPAGN